MSDDQRQITDDMQLSELTVGEFKQLMQALLSGLSANESTGSKIDPPIEKISIRRKSLDEFMSDLSD